MRRINLLRAHGSPTCYQYAHSKCRCVACRGAIKEYRSAYHAAHRVEAAAYAAIYAARHPDRARTQSAAWRATHRADVVAYSTTYYAAHREQIIAYHAARYDPDKQAAWRFSRRKERAAYNAEYRAAHLDERAAQNHRRRARLRACPGTHIAADVRAQYDRQKGRCYWCGRKVPWRKKHTDHVIPPVLGGSNGPENLVISCAFCNDSKGAKHPMDYAGRML